MDRAKACTFLASSAVLIFHIVTADDRFILHAHEANTRLFGNRLHHWVQYSIDLVFHILSIAELLLEVIADGGPPSMKEDQSFKVIDVPESFIMTLHLLHFPPKQL